ncbi:hypothetical protein [Microcoleus sp. N9_A1]|uniref:hypothetical protein n=1 Tax=Microcoleus sp. N9_A1 TaxID=3055380 RepID=UPI002FCF3876
MKDFFQNLHSQAERYMALPDKIIDTRAVFLAQLAMCAFLYAAIVVAQMTIVNRCIVPIPSSFVK